MKAINQDTVQGITNLLLRYEMGDVVLLSKILDAFD
jgi:hypothetical protein